MHLPKISARALLAALALSLSLVLTPARAATVNNFEDIEFWTGTGSNQSALVIQWNDGNAPVSLAWGFRWQDANTTVETMLLALAGSITNGPSPIAGSDVRLSISLDTFPGVSGYFVNTIAYNQIGLAGMDQVVRSQSSDNVNFNYWSFYLGGESEDFPTGGTFDYSMEFGISGVNLSNNGWFGLVYPPFDDTYDFATPDAAAVPEPSTVFLIVIAGGLILLQIRRRHVRAQGRLLAH